MKTKINEKTYDHILSHFERQLERVDKWLTFAEAKNVALIAFNISVVGAFVSKKDNLCLDALSGMFFLFIFISTLLALISFFPYFSVPKEAFRKEKKKDFNSNMIFYVDIAKLSSPTEYLRKTIHNYFPDVDKKNLDSILNNDMLKDFATEIFVNSKISVRKYNMFRTSLFFSLLSLILYFVISFN